MQKLGATNLIPLDTEIERSCRQNRRRAKEARLQPQETIAEELANAAPMEENRILLDYMIPTVTEHQSAIRKPTINAAHFELKPGILQMIQNSQFGGLPSEDPKEHVANFLEVCDTFRVQNVNEEAVRLRLFPFSLRDRAKNWLNSLPVGSITTWEDLCQKFLAKFFPLEKTTKLRNEIANFAQGDNETLSEAWARYKEMLRKCPQHGLPRWMQIQTFIWVYRCRLEH